jgi:ectoine hydroxylase-related dioxygenase (phytanoyl-CoA dioxygenase family)
MPKYPVSYSIDNKTFHYEVDGILAEPENKCLIVDDDDLTKNCAWHSDGYIAIEAWNKDVSDALQKAIKALLSDIIEATCHHNLNIELEKYHTIINDNQHLAIVESLKKLPFMAKHLIPTDALDRHVSNILNVPVSCYNPHLQLYGCNIRIVRPNRNDNNPLHKDVWLDRLRHAINLYIPIAGSNHLSSLSLIPKSHYWNESEMRRTKDNCIVNGVTFSVPSVVQSIHGLAMIRPELKNNEILIFSPYLIHGGACNLNEDITRVSLEMRFWRKT